MQWASASTYSADAARWQAVSGTPYRNHPANVIGLPLHAQMPTLTMLAEAPISVALQPSVAPSIMATNTAMVAAGQSAKWVPTAAYLIAAKLGLKLAFVHARRLVELDNRHRRPSHLAGSVEGESK